MFREDKQAICNAMCEALKLTSNAGNPFGNPLVELRYIKPDDPSEYHGYSEVVRPIFRDGTGENGYYDINVSWDSGTAVIIDIVNQFVRTMW